VRQISASFLEAESRPAPSPKYMPDYVIDLNPIHLVLRVTFRKVVTNQVVLDAYHSLRRVAAHAGPYGHDHRLLGSARAQIIG
jgi:hypothetical protein